MECLKHIVVLNDSAILCLIGASKCKSFWYKSTFGYVTFVFRISRAMFIKKTCPDKYPLILPFYIVKLGYGGVNLFFSFLLQNIDCWYSLGPPRRGGSNVHPQSMFWSKNKRNIKYFLPKILIFNKKSLYNEWACFRSGCCHVELLLSICLHV